MSSDSSSATLSICSGLAVSSSGALSVIGVLSAIVESGSAGVVSDGVGAAVRKQSWNITQPWSAVAYIEHYPVVFVLLAWLLVSYMPLAIGQTKSQL